MVAQLEIRSDRFALGGAGLGAWRQETVSIFKKIFGKKTRESKIAAPAQPAPGHLGGGRIIPAEVWNDPKLGSFLDEIGLKPDDPSNLIQNRQKEHDERIGKSQDGMNAREAAFNENLKKAKGENCRAVAFFLLGQDCWNGEPGKFLLHDLKLSPYDEWNIVHLAADAETARLCGIPVFPGRVPEMEAWCCRLVLEIKEQLDSVSGGPKFDKSLEEIKIYQGGFPTARHNVFAVANHIRGKLDELLQPT